MVDLGGYVIVLVETTDRRIRLYGKPARRRQPCMHGGAVVDRRLPGAARARGRAFDRDASLCATAPTTRPAKLAGLAQRRGAEGSSDGVSTSRVSERVPRFSTQLPNLARAARAHYGRRRRRLRVTCRSFGCRSGSMGWGARGGAARPGVFLVGAAKHAARLRPAVDVPLSPPSWQARRPTAPTWKWATRSSR